MVATRPRRLLSKHDYNNNGVAFRSARIAEEPKETDCNPDEEFPEWKQEFMNNMYKGYELALKKKAPVSFKFKGVETTLHPDQLPLDDNLIEIRIKDVLKELNRISSVSYTLLLTFLTLFFFNYYIPFIVKLLIMSFL